MSQEHNREKSFSNSTPNSIDANNPGSYNYFSNNLENQEELSYAEIVNLYSSALARYKESLKLEETDRYLTIF